jgi:Ca2+/Na+ antiporter
VSFTLIFHEVCPVKLIIGFPCAGCGMVRAFLLLMQLRFAEAYAMHPGFIPVLITFILFIILRYFTDADPKWIKICVLITLLFLIVLYVYRLFTSFGTEPIVINEDALLFRLME